MPSRKLRSLEIWHRAQLLGAWGSWGKNCTMKPPICVLSPEEKCQLFWSFRTAEPAKAETPAWDRTYLLTPEGWGGQCPAQRHSCGERTADDSLLGHSNLSLNSKDLGLGPEFTKSTHGVFFQSSAQLNKASWMTSILSVLPQGKKKATYVYSLDWTRCPFPISIHAA